MKCKFILKFCFVVIALIHINVAKGQEVYEVTAQKLNVRSRPTTKSQVIGSLYAKDLVDVYKIYNGWATINYKERDGYVSAKYLKSKVEETNMPVEETDSVFVDTVVVSQIENGKREIQEEKKPISNRLGIDFVPSVFFGYANFSADGASPKGTIGGGVDFAFQFIAHDKILFFPKNYYMEASLGYALKGSAAFPLHYIDLKLSPIGYMYDIFDFTLFGKVGAYVGYTFSSIETEMYSFDSNIDVGILCEVGVEYDNIGVGVSYERSFTDACNSQLALKNQGFYLNLSYRLFSLK